MNENIEAISATSKYIRISPTKVDLIIKQIRGKSYKQALQILKYLPQKSGAIVWQTLYSAVSNATNNFNLQTQFKKIFPKIVFFVISPKVSSIIFSVE